MKLNKGCVILATGLSGSGKTTVMNKVQEILKVNQIYAKRLDGDIGRKSFSSDLGFSSDDREKNHERAAAVASYLKLEGHLILASYIAPNHQIREKFKQICGDALVIYVDCPIVECQKRDPKGMYSKLVDNKFMGNPFTGMHPDAPYEAPQNFDLVLATHQETVEESAEKVIQLLRDSQVISD